MTPFSKWLLPVANLRSRDAMAVVYIDKLVHKNDFLVNYKDFSVFKLIFSSSSLVISI